MPAIANVGLTGDAYIDALLSEVKWAVDSVTFSFPARGSFYEPGYGLGEPRSGFEALNATQQSVARASLGMYAGLGGLQFDEMTETSTDHAALRLAMSDVPDTAWTYYPSTSPEGGDSWFNSGSSSFDVPAIGNYAYATFIHEIGHALGLEHAHDGNVMPLDRDSLEYTVMSYRSYVGASINSGYRNETWGYPQSPMMYDIAALQHMYGANYATNSGDTTYAWSPTTGEMFIDGVGQGTPGANRIFLTVWDGGGVDTYNFSNYAADLDVDLRPGRWSITAEQQRAKLHHNGSELAAGTIANAFLFRGDQRALIENAKGGWGDDVIVGNQAANTLWGNDGDDRLYGLAGDDRLVGGYGHDFVNGGAGEDLLEGGPGNDRLHGYSGSDRLYGGQGDDLLAGGPGDNLLVGGPGDDRLYGQDGDDVLKGGDGQDILVGGAGRDYLYGQHDDDLLKGYEGHDVLIGGRGDDRLYGEDGEDTLKGGEGHDTLVGGSGDDRLYGHSSDDRLYAEDGHDTLVGGLGDDTLVGGAGDDRLYGHAGNNRLIGDAGTDVLRGGDDRDVLSGSAGDDRLFGESGNDVLIGGMGGDLLIGGDGADRFVFRDTLESPPTADRDVIRDFSSAQGDRIDVRRIDADVSTAMDEAFVFIDTAMFSGTAGELRYIVNSAGHAIVHGDVDGDVSGDFQILVAFTSVLSPDDFLL